MPETMELIDPQFFGPSENYTFTNTKAGVIVTKDGEEILSSYDKALAIRKLVKECIDLDEWKHSWHNSTDYRDKETRKKLVEIINGKIEQREKEINQLKFCLKVMSRKLR